MAPSTPPPPASAEFAAFTMASAATFVMSPTSIRSSFPFCSLCSIAPSQSHGDSSVAQDGFAPRAAHIHLVFDAFNGRSREVPVNPRPSGLTHPAQNLNAQKRMYIVDRVDLCRCGLRPVHTQSGEARRHEVHHKVDFFSQRIRRRFTAADDVMRVQ